MRPTKDGMEREPVGGERGGLAKRRDGKWLAHLGVPSDRREAPIL